MRHRPLENRGPSRPKATELTVATAEAGGRNWQEQWFNDEDWNMWKETSDPPKDDPDEEEYDWHGNTSRRSRTIEHDHRDDLDMYLYCNQSVYKRYRMRNSLEILAPGRRSELPGEGPSFDRWYDTRSQPDPDRILSVMKYDIEEYEREGMAMFPAALTSVMMLALNAQLRPERLTEIDQAELREVLSKMYTIATPLSDTFNGTWRDAAVIAFACRIIFPDETVVPIKPEHAEPMIEHFLSTKKEGSVSGITAGDTDHFAEYAAHIHALFPDVPVSNYIDAADWQKMEEDLAALKESAKNKSGWGRRPADTGKAIKLAAAMKVLTSGGISVNPDRTLSLLPNKDFTATAPLPDRAAA